MLRVYGFVFCSISFLSVYMCVRIPLSSRSIAGVPSRRALPVSVPSTPHVYVPNWRMCGDETTKKMETLVTQKNLTWSNWTWRFVTKTFESKWSEDCFYYCSERNNVVVLFGTLKVQSFILTELSDCGLLIVVTSSTFLKRKDMLKEKSS